MIAINNIQRPPSIAQPTSKFLIASQTCPPIPSAPIKQASTTNANAIMITWFIPIIMLGRESGILILNNNCSLLDPKDVADSIVCSGTCLIPVFVNLIIGGIA